MSDIDAPFPAPEPRQEMDPSDYGPGEFTTGHYQNEEESAAAFDRAVPFELFKVHREVRGTLISPRPAQVERSMRIDRVLVPTQELLDLGWQFGIIGCELKNSGLNIGPAIAQAMDYGRCVWTLEPSKFHVWLNYVFIWPMAKQSGTVASICAQQRVGSAYGDGRYTRFGLKSGATRILEVQQDGLISVGKVVSAGGKAGSR